MIVAAGLIPDPNAGPPATGDGAATAIDDPRWSRAKPADSLTLLMEDGDIRLSALSPDLLVKPPESTPVDARPLPRSRRELLRAIEAALVHERAVESGIVTITASGDGTVVLAGEVRSPQDRRRAGEVAAGVRGVSALENRLSVATGAERPDAEVESDIEERLKRDDQLDPRFIRISVSNGVVTLSGAVGTAAEKRRAVEDAWTAGVRQVEASRLQVKEWAQRSRRMSDRSPAEPETLRSAELPRVPPWAVRNFLE